MSDEISTILKQAKADARVEAFFKFLQKNAKKLIYVFSGALLVLLLVVAFKIYTKNMAEKYSAMLHQAIIYQQIGDVENAQKELEKIVDSNAPSGVKSLASLRLAAFLIAQNDIEKAKELFEQVNDCRFCDAYVRDLAGLLLVKTLISSEEKNKDELIAKIKKIASKAKPLKGEILLQLGNFYLFSGDLENSGRIFTEVSEDENSSNSLKEKAKEALKIATSNGYEKK